MVETYRENKMDDGRWNKTMPWADSEFIVVDGYRLVYSIDPKTEEMMVHFHGGSGRYSPNSVPLAVLKAEGRKIQMPRTMRDAAPV